MERKSLLFHVKASSDPPLLSDTAHENTAPFTTDLSIINFFGTMANINKREVII